MTEIQNKTTIYDLEERTFQFAKAVRNFVKTLPKTISNLEDGKQLIKSSGSVGANYIEANEALNLINEADELKKIFSSILQKSK